MHILKRVSLVILIFRNDWGRTCSSYLFFKMRVKGSHLFRYNSMLISPWDNCTFLLKIMEYVTLWINCRAVNTQRPTLFTTALSDPVGPHSLALPPTWPIQQIGPRITKFLTF